MITVNISENLRTNVRKFQVVNAKWKDKNDYSSATQIGLIAQEVKNIIPELVDQDQEGFYSVQYSHLVPLLIEAIKELNSLLDQAQQNVHNLEGKVADNKDEIQQLNHLLGL